MHIFHFASASVALAATAINVHAYLLAIVAQGAKTKLKHNRIKVEDVEFDCYITKFKKNKIIDLSRPL